MDNYIKILQINKLFQDIDKKELYQALKCFNVQKKFFKKGEYIYFEGEYINNLMILIEGSILLQKEDYWGNRIIINIIEKGDLLLEAYLGANSPILNDVVAASNSEVLYFDFSKVVSTCHNDCKFHLKIIKNLFHVISYKNIVLLTKINHLSKRTTKDKLISYLSDEAIRQNNNEFEIPFNRQELADYLSIDRSAMSRELYKLKKKGLICFEKNKFRLLK